MFGYLKEYERKSPSAHSYTSASQTRMKMTGLYKTHEERITDIEVKNLIGLTRERFAKIGW